MADLFMVFDVESIGLHGEGFAVGYVVVRADGQELYAARYACDPDNAAGTAEDREWVAKNIPPLVLTHPTSPSFVRHAFWLDWLQWKAQGAVLVSDCGWPVEARFLAACVDDDPEQRAWQGPYPLYDVSSAMRMGGRDPLATYDRLPNELPAHDPLTDARQSARLWLECLNWAVVRN